MKHPESDWSRGGGENFWAPRTGAEVQPSQLPTQLAARKECGPYAQAAVLGGGSTAARGSLAGRKQTGREKGEGASAGMGVVGREDLAPTLQRRSAAAQPLPTGAQIPVPARRCREGTNTEGPCTSGARSPQGHRLGAPPPRSALPERAIWVPRVPTGRAQPAPLAEELLEQRRGHADHGQTRVAP